MINDAQSTRGKVPWRLTLAATAGNTVEFYDFNVYGTMTALVLTPLFFPTADATVGTLLAFGVFAVGFLSRPLGGIIFGHFGDRIGRKPMLILTFGVMGLATFLIGVLPTYASIGIAAPILLTVLRFVQGFGIGGEWGAAVTLMVEHAPPRRRGLYGSLVQTGSALGLILSSLTITVLLTVLTKDQLLAWGWRIPFLLSVVLVVIGMIVRANVEESPEFTKAKAKQPTHAPSPLRATLRTQPLSVLTALGVHLAPAAIGFVIGVFGLSYATTQLHLDAATVVQASLVGLFVYLVGIVVGGYLSDIAGRRRMYLVFATLLIPAAFVFFALLNTGSIPLLYLAFSVANLLGGLVYGVEAAFISELFSTRVRYTGSSTGFQLATVLGGGLMPTIAALLAADGTTARVSIYFAVLGVISVVAGALSTRLTIPADIPDEADTPDARSGAV